jgi:hypothetical protein
MYVCTTASPYPPKLSHQLIRSYHLISSCSCTSRQRTWKQVLLIFCQEMLYVQHPQPVLSLFWSFNHSKWRVQLMKLLIVQLPTHLLQNRIEIVFTFYRSFMVQAKDVEHITICIATLTTNKIPIQIWLYHCYSYSCQVFTRFNDFQLK